MVGVVDALPLLPLHLGVGLGLQLLLDEVVLVEVEGDGLVLVERIFIKPETSNMIELARSGLVLQCEPEVSSNEAVTSIFSHLFTGAL